MASNPWSYNTDGTAVVSPINNNPDTGGITPDSSTYPAMANDYGLGSQSAPGNASAANYATQPVTLNLPDTNSKGLNPFSIQGESNARGN